MDGRSTYWLNQWMVETNNRPHLSKAAKKLFRSTRADKQRQSRHKKRSRP